jgi:IS30 family transposase
MSHLTEHQRYTISTMLENGYKQIEIAAVIEKDKSVISREINRNKDKRSGKYRHDLANRKYRYRQKTKPKQKRFTQEVQDAVEFLLKQDYSPEQVFGTLKKQQKQTVSIERIYQHIWKDKKQQGSLYTHLRNQGRKYRKRGSTKDNRGIITGRIMLFITHR